MKSLWNTAINIFIVFVLLLGVFNIAQGIAIGDLKNITIGMLFILYVLQRAEIKRYERQIKSYERERDQ